MMSRMMSLGAALLLASCAGTPAGPGASGITHGPMLGRPGAHRMGVWARTARPGSFRVRYGTQKERLDKVSASVKTRRHDDHTGWVLLEDLKSDTRYHYRLETGSGAGPSGSFRTLPDPADVVNGKTNPKGLFNFRFEFACGNNQGMHSLGPSLPTYKTMNERIRDDIHFAILNGDWLYEDPVRGLPADAWKKQVGLGSASPPRTVALTPTIVGVWENYKLYLDRAPHLGEWHRHVPSYYTFDDHEILNDVIAAGEPGFRARRTVFRDIAVQAWYDYLGWSNPDDFPEEPHFGRAAMASGSHVLIDKDADFTKLDVSQRGTLHVHWGTADAGVDDNELDEQEGAPNAGVYEIVKVLGKTRLQVRPAAKANGQVTYSIGRFAHSKRRVANTEFFFLDTRSHRNLHDLRRADKPGVSMLGSAQRDWLMKSMRGSDADAFFVVSSVNFMVPHVGAGGMAKAAPNKDDAWTAFLHERKQLIDFWDGLGKPVFILTGDLHNSFAIKITDRVWEFASGPHNSRNHPAGSEGGRPPNGVYDSRGRKCDIRWSTYFAENTRRDERKQPVYCVVQVNNVFKNPSGEGGFQWVAYPHPQVVFQYYDGFRGDLLYAESIRIGK